MWSRMFNSSRSAWGRMGGMNISTRGTGPRFGGKTSEAFKFNAANNSKKTGLSTLLLLAGATAAGVGLAAYVSTQEFQVAHAAEKVSIRERVIQNYENRIRALSTPEKIFGYFASVKKDGELFMTPEDFIRAITPYEFPEGGVPAEKTEWTNDLAKNTDIPNFFRICDTNGDGLLSFQEYFFFITLLSIPERDFEIAFKMIDENSNGVIDEQEFLTLLHAMTNRSSMGQRQRTFDDKPQNNLKPGVLPFFFGADGKKELPFATFSKFLTELQTEVRRLEFALYDKEKNGTISLHSFAKLIISHANLRNLQEYEKRLATISTTESITFDEYSRFEDLLNSLDDMQVAIETYGGNVHFTKDTFKKAAYAVGNIKVDQKIIDVIFTVFDANGDLQLEPEEFVNVMKRHKSKALQEERDTGFTRTIDCIKNCVFGK